MNSCSTTASSSPPVSVPSRTSRRVLYASWIRNAWAVTTGSTFSRRVLSFVETQWSTNTRMRNAFSGVKPRQNSSVIHKCPTQYSEIAQ